MLAKRIIPCLDVKDGRVVKGVNFVGLRDAGDPVEAAARYNEQGADELTFLDITATSDGRDLILPIIEAVASQVFIPLTVGGGVREVADVRRLLNAGADKVSFNSAAVARPELIREASDVYGSQCIVVAIDAKSNDQRRLERVHAWWPQGHRPGCDRVGQADAAARRWRDPAHQHGPRRHPRRLQPRPDARRQRCRRHAGDRQRRRRHACSTWSTASATAAPMRCWRPASFTTASTRWPRPRPSCAPPASRSGYDARPHHWRAHHRRRVAALLPVPDLPGLRPTGDRMRETLFNWLGQDLNGWRVHRRLCRQRRPRPGGGLARRPGAAGREGCPRRGQPAPDHRAAQRARKRVQLKQGDGLAALEAGGFDLALLDPPFDAKLFDKALAAAAQGAAWVYLEAPGAHGRAARLPPAPPPEGRRGARPSVRPRQSGFMSPQSSALRAFATPRGGRCRSGAALRWQHA